MKNTKRDLYKKSIVTILFAVFLSYPVYGQRDWEKVINGIYKAATAYTLTDEQLVEYAKESVNEMDNNNHVLPESSSYTKRLRRLTKGIAKADGIPLNFKAYKVKDVNAFACPDGSVRVFSSLMDIMNDDELLGVIGHEIGHVLKHHSKNALKQKLYTSAFKDAIESRGGRMAELSSSMLGTLGESFVNAKYSQKQEIEADDCGYDFLKSKGKNPWGIVMAFEKLQNLEGKSNTKLSYVQKMFSSHPETKERIDRLKSRCKKDGIARP